MGKVEKYNQYVANHPNWMEKYDVRRNSGGLFNINYGRIIIPVEQTVEGFDKKIQHTYAAAINLSNGDIYYDCEKTKITFKNGWMGLYKPLRTVFKTIYHATIIFPIINEFMTWSKAEKEDKTWGHLSILHP